MKIRKTLAALTSLALVLTLASCEKKPKDANVQDTASDHIENYFLSSDIEIQGRPENSYNSLFCPTDSRMFVISNYSGKEPENLFLTVNTKTGEKTELLKSLDEFSGCYNLKMHGEKIYFLYEKNDRRHMVSMNRSTGEVISDKTFDDNVYIPSVSFVDDEVWFIEARYEEDANIFTICRCDPDTLEYKSQYVQKESKSDVIGKGAYVDSAYLNDDGSYCFVWVEYGEDFDYNSKYVSGYSAEHELLFETAEMTDMAGLYMGSGISSSGNLFVSSYSDNQYFINEVDMNTGEICGRYNIESDFIHVLKGVRISGYDMVVSSDDGICGCVFEKGKFEKLYDYDEISESIGYCVYGSYDGDEILIYSQTDDYDGQIIAEFDENGNNIANHKMNFKDENSFTEHAASSSDGKIYYMEYAGGYSQDNDIYMHCLDTKTDKETNFLLPKKYEGGMELSYVNEISADDNGNIVLSFLDNSDGRYTNYYCVLDEKGSVKNIKSADEIIKNKDISYISHIIFGNDNTAYISGYDKLYNNFIADFDTDKFEMGEKIEFEFTDYAELVPYGGNEYSFCFSDTDGVYGYSAKDKTVSEIMNFYDTDMKENSGYYNVSVADSGTVALSTYESRDSHNEMLIFLKKADGETLEKINSRQIINVACVNTSMEVKQKIKEFNRKSEDHRIQVKNYDKYRTVLDRYTSKSGVGVLTEDIISGNIPDVVIGNYELDTFSYVRNGFYTDLNKFIEKDEEVNKEDFMGNIFDAYTFDGKLYQVTPVVTFRTIVGKSSKLGKETGWTFDEFFKADEDENIFYGEYRDYAVKALITENLSEFVDFEKLTCDFENEKFTKLIELLKRETMSAKERNDILESEGEKINRKFIDDRCTAENFVINSFESLIMEQVANICEDTVIKGIPSAEKTAGLICPEITFGIAEKSKVKDAAWSFVREFLLDENVSSEYIYNIPIRKAKFEKTVDRLYKQERTAATVITNDVTGKRVTVSRINSDAEKKIESLVQDSGRVIMTDTSIGKIIEEQLDIYFDGGQSAEETAKAVQNKVTLYMSEIK